MVVVGLVIAAIGGLVWMGVFKWLRLGRLPGDVAIQRDGVSIYIPVVSMLLISGILSLLFWIVGAIRK